MRQVMAEPLGVLDRPLARGPGLGPGGQRLVVGEGGVDADRAEVGLVTGSTAVAVWVDLWGSMPMTIMEDGSLLC